MTAAKPSAEERNEKVRAVLRAATGPMTPSMIAQKIAEPWCCLDGIPGYAMSAPISPVLKRIGAVRVHPSGKWTLPGGAV